MKKFTAFILALVLMFSLSVTALAEGEIDSENKGITTVSLIFDGTQISATVPLTVTLAVDSSGDVTGPSGYEIQNTSVMPVKVTNVVIAAKSGFAMTDSELHTDTVIGKITLTDGREGTATTLDEWVPAKTSTEWNLGAKNSATANMDLEFGGAVTGIVQDITSAKEAFTVTFTIEAGAFK